jgi:hypothetical protein
MSAIAFGIQPRAFTKGATARNWTSGWHPI